MKDKVGMSERVEVRHIDGKCERCNGALMMRENGVVCISCGGMHERVNGKWVYMGGGR